MILAFICTPGISFGQLKAKDHYKKGETLLKEGYVYAAVEAFRQAAKLEPTNKKFSRKLSEVQKMASLSAESKGRELIENNPRDAEIWVRRALEYDSSNTSANEALRIIQSKVTLALERAKEAQSAIDNGNLDLAEDIVKSIHLFRNSAQAIVDLEKELYAAKRTITARALWQNHEIDKSIEELSIADREAPNSVFVKRTSKTIRQEISSDLILKATTSPVQTPKEILEKLHLINKAKTIDANNQAVLEFEKKTVATLAELFLGKDRFLSNMKLRNNTGRVWFEALHLMEPLIMSDARYNQEKNETESIAYPALRIRVVVGDLHNCPTSITKGSIRHKVREALGHIVLIDEAHWDLTLNIKNISCTSTDIPKQLVQSVNSTYVAGHNQLDNPEYLRLLVELNSAQRELDRASIANRDNPNFWTGLSLGMAQSRVNSLRRALSTTPPYITREIIQQYHYEKYEAYRAYKIESALQLYGKSSGKAFSTETTVSHVAEDRREGVSGVLPQDNTKAQNVSATLLPLDHYANLATDQFQKKLETASKDILSGYFATIAMSEQIEFMDRFSTLLYLFDLADGTQYEAERQRLSQSVKTALLSGIPAINSFVKSLSIPVPKQLVLEDSNAEEAPPARPMLESIMESILSIETDAGKKGSGFFLTNACLVITNEHVVAGAETIVMKVPSGKIYVAEVLAKDIVRDLALLRSNARVCKPLSLGDSSKAAIGQDIYAVGSPLDLSGTVTKGIISAFRATEKGVRYIQLDAASNPGNSGGPLVNRNGLVLGVLTFKYKGSEGLNFAIASSEIGNAFGRFIH